MDTIFALATAPGKAGVAVVRLSGEDVRDVASKLCGNGLPKRGMSLRSLKNHKNEKLDQALVLTFEAPASFTGENVVEFQIHGSVACVSAVLAALSRIKGARIAEPGEFTRRALENGKLDLAQVEGLADLIDAETEAQRRQAQLVLSGALGQITESWRDKLIRSAALIEATIDFADEDVPVDVTPEVSALLGNVRKELESEVAGVEIAERIRDGFEVAIIGAPNVGKSTLLNALAGREAAITSEIAGTTRDVIEVRMDLNGLPVTLLDTAGIRETSDIVEGKGIDLAKSRADQADLRVFLVESDETFDIEKRKGDILVQAKGDRFDNPAGSVSGLTGVGLDVLVRSITTELTKRSAGVGIATRERHRSSIMNALNSIISAQVLLESGPKKYDIAAEELRSAVRTLGLLIGHVGVEDLLDEIFSSFCLGK